MILRPHGIAAPYGHGVQHFAAAQGQRPLQRHANLPGGHGRGLLRGIAHGKIGIRNLCAAPAGGRKQLHIVGVALDHAAANAGFKGGNKQNALGNGQIAQPKPQPRRAGVIHRRVGQHNAPRNQRQPKILFGVGQAAFGRHQHHRAKTAQPLPPDHAEVKRAIGVGIIGKFPQGLPGRKPEHQLVKIVGEHQRQQHGGDCAQRPVGPIGRGVAGPAQRKRGKQAHQRDKQHGQIV